VSPDQCRQAREAVGIGFPFEIANGRAGTAGRHLLASRSKGGGGGIGREWNAAIRMTIQRDLKIDGLGVRGPLHGLDALLDRLKSGSEHGCGQLGYALAIADSGFDPFLDQPLL
jgi:hypothetical protein